MRPYHFLAGVLVFVVTASGQTTRPASRTSTQIQAELDAAKTAVEKARSAAIAAYDNGPGKADVAKLAELEQSLIAARASGTSQQKLSASSAFNTHRLRVESARKNFVDSDPALKKATARASQLEAESHAAQGRERQQAQMQAKAASDKRAAEQAAAREAAIPRITLQQLDLTGEKYVNQEVKVEGIYFARADNLWVDELPGVTIVSNGLRSIVRKNELERWIGFMAQDAEGELFQHIFALKDDHGEKVLSLKRGDKLNLRGLVVELENAGWYGLVCTGIEVVPQQDGKRKTSR